MVLADMGNSPVRILLVDDYEPYRQKIRSILEMRPELQVIGIASPDRKYCSYLRTPTQRW
jgi:DNA-binding NarL/FixJ family response regulator